MLSVTSLWNLVTRVGSVVESTINDQTIRIAVTGLSRAGKTVFLTSLLVNLLAMRAGRQTLPAFQSLLDQHGPGRLRNIRLMPAGASTTPRFDVLAKLADLAAAQPHWPARTEDLATVELELEVKPAPGVLNGLRAAAGTPRLRLEFLDYPGEWLLDLPLLQKSFATWSAETLALLRQPPRAPLAAPFLDFLGVINPTAPAEDALLLRGHRLYQQVLQRCRDELGLSY